MKQAKSLSRHLMLVTLFCSLFLGPQSVLALITNISVSLDQASYSPGDPVTATVTANVQNNGAPNNWRCTSWSVDGGPVVTDNDGFADDVLGTPAPGTDGTKILSGINAPAVTGTLSVTLYSDQACTEFFAVAPDTAIVVAGASGSPVAVPALGFAGLMLAAIGLGAIGVAGLRNRE